MADEQVHPETANDEVFTPTVVAEEEPTPESAVLTPDQKVLEGAIDGIKPAEPIEEETVVTPAAAPTHPVELVAQATHFGLSPEEIEGMSAAELRSEIRQAKRFAEFRQQVTTTAPVVEEKPKTGALEAAIAKAKETLLPEQIEVFEAALAEVRELRADSQAQRQAVQTNSFTAVRQRVNGHLDAVAPGVSKQFDPSTQQGQKLEHALYQQLRSLEYTETLTGKPVSEDVRVRRALAALDMLPVADPKETEKKAALEKAKEVFAAGALGTPTNRKSASSVELDLREKLKKHGKPVGKPTLEADKVEWLDG